MSSSEQRKVIFTEQDILDARRLLAVLDERSRRKAAGRLEGPAQIADQLLSPADERADGENDQGVSTFDRRPQLTATRGEGEVGSGLGSWRGSGPVETREGDVAMRPPAQPSAGSYSNGFTIEAEARNAHSGKSD